jgi:acetate---CoA ligase (ADP-forming)
MFEAFFNPRGVAVIGASSNPKKLGYGIVRNLIAYGYRGAIYPVNPKAGEILGQRCYPDVAEAPDPLDLAVIIVAAPLAPGVLERCGRRGIGHAIIVSGGFGETGPEGRALEQSLAEIGRRYGIRLMGPNCIGTIDTHAPFNTTFVTGMPRPGDIGFVSQSGAMCAVVFDWARGAGVGFSRIVSLGNQVDVSEAEMLSALADDPRTGVITAYIEGVSDGRAFMVAAEAAARRKPVVALKGGRGKGGVRAVASHTGALAGSAEAYDAAFERSGVLRADTMEGLFDWARALAWQPLPRGEGVAVLTNAGGPGIMAVDALESAGLTLAPLTDATRDYLRPRLPPASSVDNPVDILAGSGPDIYAIALEALLADPTVDAALVIQAPQDWFLPASLAEVVAEVAAGQDKPVLASIMGLASVDQALEVLRNRRVPNFAFPERAAPALAAMVARRRWLDAPGGAAEELSDVNRAAAAAALAPGDFSAALAAYGIGSPATRPAATAEEAVRLAEELGYPVALKLDSPDISHKSDVGGVRLDLADAAAVAGAFGQITGGARQAHREAVIRGVLVQPMLVGGWELIVGVKRDPQFGPMVLIGSGGVEVELQRDVALGIAPLSLTQAGQLLDRTLAGVRLRGWRGQPEGDRQAVIEVMRRMAQLALDFPEIVELEVNPLIVLARGHGAHAVDVRGRLESSAASEGETIRQK